MSEDVKQLTWDKDGTPTNYNQEVLPAYLGEADWCSLQKNDGCCELTKKREAHSDRPDLGRKNLGYPKIHRRIATRSLERQIQKYEEDAERVADLVCRASILGDHRSQATCSHQASSKTSDEHLTARVDLVVQPGTARVIDQASGGQPDRTQ